MPIDPTTIIGEVLCKKSAAGANPKKDKYHCRYMGSRCTKSVSNKIPYPVCTIIYDSAPVAVCPKRFFEINLLKDVVDNCWPGEPPKAPELVSEVNMKGFGNVDFVAADFDAAGEVQDFLSVELQAIDITGSVRPAYAALLKSQMLPKRPTFGLNWDNVYKRYVTQLIRKGYFHHHWGSKVVGVMQDVVLDDIYERFGFMRTEDVKNSSVNIIFMSYAFTPDPAAPSGYRLKLKGVQGTSHASLQQAVLYAKAPSRGQFAEQIKKARGR